MLNGCCGTASPQADMNACMKHSVDVKKPTQYMSTAFKYSESPSVIIRFKKRLVLSAGL